MDAAREDAGAGEALTHREARVRGAAFWASRVESGLLSPLGRVGFTTHWGHFSCETKKYNFCKPPLYEKTYLAERNLLPD